jgi:O-antigen/teichoic acid export membrane protein
MLWLHGTSYEAYRSSRAASLSLYKSFCDMATITIDILRDVVRMKITSEKVVVVVGRAIDAIGSLVFLKMLASAATKQDVGTYLLASSFLAIALTVSFSAFDQGLLRNITEYSKRVQLAARYSAMLVAYAVIAMLLSVAFGVILTTTDIAQALRPVMAPMSLWLVCESIKNLNQTVASGVRSRTLIAVASAADYGCRISLLAWFAMDATVEPSTIVSLLAISGIAATATYLVGQRSLLARFSWNDVRNTLLDSIRFSWPMIIWGLFGWLQNMSNRWLLSSFADLSVVAEYGVLVSIASFPVAALLGVVVTYFVPILYEQESSNKASSRQIVKKVALILTPLCALMVSVATAWHREITLLLSGPEYVAHSNMLPVIMAAACFNAICSVLTYAVYAQRRVLSLLMANTVPGAFSLAFGYLTVRSYQFEGAVLTLVLSQLLAGVLFVLTFLRTKPTTSASCSPQSY